jgi:hypothetical protein
MCLTLLTGPWVIKWCGAVSWSGLQMCTVLPAMVTVGPVGAASSRCVVRGVPPQECAVRPALVRLDGCVGV